MSAELILTFAILIAEIGLIALCRFKLKQPPNPQRPRILPYGAFMIMLSFGALLTVAHTVSLVTGKQLTAKTKMRGQ
jgi:TRAP-type C4-dicarboxylate transport system permease small subunit